MRAFPPIDPVVDSVGFLKLRMAVFRPQCWAVLCHVCRRPPLGCQGAAWQVSSLLLVLFCVLSSWVISAETSSVPQILFLTMSSTMFRPSWTFLTSVYRLTVHENCPVRCFLKSSATFWLLLISWDLMRFPVPL